MTQTATIASGESTEEEAKGSERSFSGGEIVYLRAFHREMSERDERNEREKDQAAGESARNNRHSSLLSSSYHLAAPVFLQKLFHVLLGKRKENVFHEGNGSCGAFNISDDCFDSSLLAYSFSFSLSFAFSFSFSNSLRRDASETVIPP